MQGCGGSFWEVRGKFQRSFSILRGKFLRNAGRFSHKYGGSFSEMQRKFSEMRMKILRNGTEASQKCDIKFSEMPGNFLGSAGEVSQKCGEVS